MGRWSTEPPLSDLDGPPQHELAPKIANVRLMAEPSDTSKVVATLARGEELVVIGAVKDGFVKVQSAAASGWVKMVLVTRRQPRQRRAGTAPGRAQRAQLVV
jgi:hypothetical protein